MRLIGQNYVPLGDNVRKSPIKPGPYPDASRSSMNPNNSPINAQRSPVNIGRSPIDRTRAPLGRIFGNK